MTLDQPFTPCLILDPARMQRNIDRMAARADALGIGLRPHFKTPKSLPVARALVDAGAVGFTTSTLQEAEYLFGGGFDDIFVAVPIDGAKVARAAALIRAGCRLSLLVDRMEALEQLAAAADREAVVLPLWVEIDIDHYRTGIDPNTDAFLDMLGLLDRAPGLRLAGLMSYGGASYGCTPEGAAQLAERHRCALLGAADALEKAGLGRPILSFGSTPAVLHARHLRGIDELRCGIYVFQDLLQAGIGAARVDDIAVSVLTSVIGVAPELNRFTIDAGGLALSKDRSTQGLPFDAGFGLVCDAESCAPVDDLQVAMVSQELGIVTSKSGAGIDFAAFPVGRRLRILPNHADMTAAAYEVYHLIEDGRLTGIWSRTNRW